MKIKSSILDKARWLAQLGYAVSLGVAENGFEPLYISIKCYMGDNNFYLEYRKNINEEYKMERIGRSETVMYRIEEIWKEMGYLGSPNEIFQFIAAGNSGNPLKLVGAQERRISSFWNFFKKTYEDYLNGK